MKRSVGRQVTEAMVSGGSQPVGRMEVMGQSSITINHVEGPIKITRLPRMLDKVSIEKHMLLLSHVNPSMNPKVTEGSSIGHKTRLGLSLPRL